MLLAESDNNSHRLAGSTKNVFLGIPILSNMKWVALASRSRCLCKSRCVTPDLSSFTYLKRNMIDLEVCNVSEVIDLPAGDSRMP